jgi:hypothetical protein
MGLRGCSAFFVFFPLSFRFFLRMHAFSLFSVLCIWKVFFFRTISGVVVDSDPDPASSLISDPGPATSVMFGSGSGFVVNSGSVSDSVIYSESRSDFVLKVGSGSGFWIPVRQAS